MTISFPAAWVAAALMAASGQPAKDVSPATGSSSAGALNRLGCDFYVQSRFAEAEKHFRLAVQKHEQSGEQDADLAAMLN
ncbi:MAG: tetratricopeptide repeat protein, partial [Bryobacteraceae bacterium]